MADTVTLKKLPKPLFNGVPYGNRSVLQYTLVTNSSGVLVDPETAAVASDHTDAVQAADTILTGIIPAGTRILDCKALVSNVGQASTTATIGFAYVDGVDSTTVPQDADYFFAALALDAQSRTAANNLAVVPLTLPKDAYLTVLNNVAAQDEAMRLDILIECVLTGTP